MALPELIWALERGVARRLKGVKENCLGANLYILMQGMSRKGAKRAVLFPDVGGMGQSADLRGYALASELKKFDWRVIVVPPWVDLEYRLKVLRRENPDVVVLQQSRHLLNRPELYQGYCTIFDVDDADYVRDGEVVASCCRTASLSVVGNRHLEEVFRNYGAPHTEVVWTGTYIHSVPGAKANEDRDEVITWAPSFPETYKIEAAFIQRLLLNLAKRRKFTFRIYSYQPQWATAYVAPLREAGITIQTYGYTQYSKFIKSLATTAIGLHPVSVENEFSRGKSFGKLLAYMAADAAVVTSNEVDHPLFFRHGKNGMLVNSLEEWTDACQFLLDHPSERGVMVRDARVDFLARLTTNEAAMRMSAIMDRFVVKADDGAHRPRGALCLRK